MASPIADIRILSIQGRLQLVRRQACFLVALNGEVQVQREGHATFLSREDILLIEPDQPFGLSGHGNNLLMIVCMEYDFYVQSRAGRGLGRIVCNSAEDSARDYSILRRLLSHIAMVYFDRGAVCREIRIMEPCYALLYLLSTSHYSAPASLPEEGAAGEDRSRQIIAYLESNYMREIQLEDLAKATFLSTAYLSRLFKKMTGTNFKSYLEAVRLRHAAEELRCTDSTITAVAYNNGFPNAGALNTAIRRKYGVSPRELRRQLTAAPEEHREDDAFREVEFDRVRESLETLAGSEKPRALGKYYYPMQERYFVEDVTKSTPVLPLWKSMINVGIVGTLHRVGAQLALLQEDIGFHYARLEYVLSESSIPTLRSGQYNFSYFDRAVELLRAHKLTPFLDLSFMGEQTLQQRAELPFRGDRPRARRTELEFLDKAAALVRHCINIFGFEEVNTWALEVCAPQNEEMALLETPEEYVRRFAAAFHTIKQLLPDVLIGGPEQHVGMDREFLLRVAELLGREHVAPDFISLCAVPYMPAAGSSGADASHMLSPDPNYIRNSVADIREALHVRAGCSAPLWVSVLAPDIRVRNHLNDSCYQSAFFVKSTVELLGLAEVIGYWQLSDMDAEYTDTTRLLFGGTGILSKDGLKKPAFTALKRLGRFHTRLVDRADGMLMTTNGINSYEIALYNYIHFSDLYCLSGGEGLELENVYTVFRNSAAKDVVLRLRGLPAGHYRVITTTLNREHGSLFDAWLRYGVLDGLTPHDIHYLRDTVHPSRAVRFIDCAEGEIELSMQLMPHEVKFMIILREL